MPTEAQTVPEAALGLAYGRHAVVGICHHPAPHSLGPHTLKLRIDGQQVFQQTGLQPRPSQGPCRDPPAPQQPAVGQRAVVVEGKAVVLRSVGWDEGCGQPVTQRLSDPAIQMSPCSTVV